MSPINFGFDEINANPEDAFGFSGPFEFFREEPEHEGEGRVYRQIPEKEFFNMSEKDRNAVVIRNEKNLFHSQVGLDHIPDNAVAIDENDERKSLLGERTAVALNPEQFTLLHKKIIQIALRCLPETQKKNDKPQKIPNFDRTHTRQPAKAIEANSANILKTNIAYRKELKYNTRKLVEIYRSKIKNREEVNNEETENKIKIEDQENKREVKKDVEEYQEKFAEIQKTDSGLAGPPIIKDVGSMSEQEKNFKEGIGSNPNV